MWGSPEEAAQLLLPRGSVLLGAAAETLQLPAKETPLGIVEVPPRNYYRCVSTSLLVAVAGLPGGGSSGSDAWYDDTGDIGQCFVPACCHGAAHETPIRAAGG